MDLYFEHSSKGSDSNSVWQYFLRANDCKTAKCKKCEAIIKTGGGSTKGMHTHLTSIHKIESLKRSKSSNETQTASTSVESGSQRKQLKVTDFLLGKITIKERLARMVAKDGLSFNVIACSQDIREGLVALGYKVPSSHHTLRDYVMEFAEEVKTKCSNELHKNKETGDQFALTFDEWTSIKGRRYMNINIHSSKGFKYGSFWNLGLVRIKESMPAETCVEILASHLRKFGIRLNKDICGMTTDGASVMVKVGKLLESVNHQLCMAHGVHLSVIDTIYSSIVNKASEYENASANTQMQVETDRVLSIDENESSSDDDDVAFKDTANYATTMFEFVSEIEESGGPEISYNISEVIRKVRKLSTKFRKSPSKNDTLQKYVKADHQMELSLLSETKTRWNSMVAMLQRFILIKDSIQKACIDLKIQMSFAPEEIYLLQDIVSGLRPVEMAVNALCRRDSTLLTADAALLFLLQHLGSLRQSPFILNLRDNLKIRIKNRRTTASTALQYLHDAQYDFALEYELNPNFNPPSQITLRKWIKSFLPDQEETQSNTLGYESEGESTAEAELVCANLQLSLEQKFEMAISQATLEKTKETQRNRCDIDALLKKEIAVFESSGKRAGLLCETFNCLKSVRPTSVESERCFSSAGILCSRIRTRLEDKTLDSLVFLRSYFQSQAS